jgi:hypothetical protein
MPDKPYRKLVLDRRTHELFELLTYRKLLDRVSGEWRRPDTWTDDESGIVDEFLATLGEPPSPRSGFDETSWRAAAYASTHPGAIAVIKPLIALQIRKEFAGREPVPSWGCVAPSRVLQDILAVAPRESTAGLTLSRQMVFLRGHGFEIEEQRAFRDGFLRNVLAERATPAPANDEHLPPFGH